MGMVRAYEDNKELIRIIETIKTHKVNKDLQKIKAIVAIFFIFSSSMVIEGFSTLFFFKHSI